jgi:hypothetical protein
MKQIAVALAIFTSTVAAHAETTAPADLEPGTEYYSTYFSFSVRGAGVTKAIDTEPTKRVPIDLPAEFVGWRCYRTAKSSSTHGVDYENIACWHGSFTVGVSLACHNGRESHDAKSLFLSAPGANGTVDVQISGVCVTTLETVRYDDGF